MKKISSLFIFFILVMGIFFLSEVQATNFTVDLDDIGEDDVVVAVKQGATVLGALEESGKINVTYPDEDNTVRSKTVKVDGNGNFMTIVDADNKAEGWRNQDVKGQANIYIDLTNRYVFSYNEEIEVFVATESDGMKNQQCNLFFNGYRETTTAGYYVLIQMGDTKESNELYKENEKARANLKLDLNGRAALAGNGFVKFEEAGVKTISMQLMARKVNVYVEIKVRVDEKAISLGGTLNVDELLETSEEQCNSGDLRVIVAAGNEKIDQRYEDIKDEYTKNISITQFNIVADSVIDVFLYYEKSGINDNKEYNSFYLETTSSDIEVIDIYHDFDSSNNNAYYGRALIKFKKTTGKISIPLIMKTKQKKGKYNIIHLNINLFATEDGEEETREETPFVDVLTNITDYEPNSGNSSNEIENKVSIILTIITNIGIIVAILMSALVGIKYMVGSIEEKAEYKKDMIPYLVGACMLFGVCTLVKILQAIGNNINNI